MGVNMPDLGIDKLKDMQSVSDHIIQNTQKSGSSHYDRLMRDLYGATQETVINKPLGQSVARPVKKKPKRLHVPVEDDTLLGGFSGLGRMSEEEARQLERHMASLDPEEFI